MGKIRKIFVSLLILIMVLTPAFAEEEDLVYFGAPLINQTSKNVSFQIVPFLKGKYTSLPKFGASSSQIKGVFGYNLNDYDIDTKGEFSELIWPDVKMSDFTRADDFDREMASEIMTKAVSSVNEILYFYYDWDTLPGEGDVKEEVSKILSAIEGANGKLDGNYYDFSNQVRIYTYRGFVTAYQEKNPSAVKQVIKQVENAVSSANANNSKLKGTEANDFVILASRYDDGQNGNLLKDYEWFRVVQWSFPKGYYEGQVSPDSEGKNVAGNKKVTLPMIAHYANLAYTKSKTTVENRGFKALTTTSSVEKNMEKLFGQNLLTGFWTMLGFENPGDLILNTKSSSYYLGLMPKSWWNIAGNMFWVSEVLAVVILIVSLVYTSMKQSAATFSPTVRNSIKDSLMNTIFAIMLIVAYPAIFYILAKINLMIVETCASFNLAPITFSNDIGSASGFTAWIIKLLFSFINLGLILKINIDYLTRSIMIVILHVIAPAAIATISIGGTSRSLFSRWLKELVSTIYMQGFDAIVLTILMMVLNSGYGGKWWWNQVFIFIIAALNSWFRTSVIGLNDSVKSVSKDGYAFADRYANTAQGLTTAAAMVGIGAVAGVAAGAAGGAAAGEATAGAAGTTASGAGAAGTGAANAATGVTGSGFANGYNDTMKAAVSAGNDAVGGGSGSFEAGNPVKTTTNNGSGTNTTTKTANPQNDKTGSNNVEAKPSNAPKNVSETNEKPSAPSENGPSNPNPEIRPQININGNKDNSDNKEHEETENVAPRITPEADNTPEEKPETTNEQPEPTDTENTKQLEREANTEMANTSTEKNGSTKPSKYDEFIEKAKNSKAAKAAVRVAHNPTFQSGLKMAAGSILEMGSASKDGIGSRIKDNGYRNATKAILGGEDNSKDQHVPRTEKEANSYSSNSSNNVADINIDEETIETKNEKKKDEDEEEKNRLIDEKKRRDLDLQEELDSMSGDGSMNV